MNWSKSIWEDRTSKTRADIVEAAMKLFLENGFEPTSITAIADEAGIARRTFFRYFATKESVVFADFTARQAKPLTLLESRPHGEPAMASLLHVLRDVTDHPIDPKRAKRIRQIVATSPTLRERQRAIVLEGFGEQLVATLARREPAGSDLALRVIVSSALGCLEVATMQYLRGSTRSVRDHFEEAVKISHEAWLSAESALQR